ncbi:MAG: D-alanine--D-alanine ligase [Bdellovibrionaceae bacterium]|nr:D-alanine--D-alanine ligase [Pseudobdellovibrionaceae bacterium]
MRQDKNKKLNVAILFGGKSGEHEVSIVSAMSVYRALDKSKFDVTLIGIDKTGRWLAPDQSLLLGQSSNPRFIELNKMAGTATLIPYESDQQFLPVTSSVSGSLAPAAKQNLGPAFDVILPILHGTFGEDGTMQGLLELANVPYVGSGVLGSALGMDKDVSRRLLAAAGIPVVKTKVLIRSEFQKDPNGWIRRMAEEFSYPHFVKPANAGSSVGVHKVKSLEGALAQYHDAFAFDVKVLVEQAIMARELEVSVLGNWEPRASVVGEVIPSHEFYSYEAKYIDENGAQLKIPAENLTDAQKTKIQEMAVQAFKVLECRGLARVDFFLDRRTNEIYLNEINTIPGFTNISMYPKLWEASGLSYSNLLEELIRLALERHQEKNSLKTTYDSKK